MKAILGRDISVDFGLEGCGISMSVYTLDSSGEIGRGVLRNVPRQSARKSTALALDETLQTFAVVRADSVQHRCPGGKVRAPFGYFAQAVGDSEIADSFEGVRVAKQGGKTAATGRNPSPPNQGALPSCFSSTRSRA